MDYTKFEKRVMSFLWRYGAFVIVSVATYLTNTGDIKEIDLSKLGALFVIGTATYVVNEVTKYLNTNQ